MITSYQTTFLDYLSLQFKEEEPAGLYDPMRYILELGGKRIRPVLALLAADAVGGDVKKALPAALAVEVFHNFSLVHDDIMDEAPLRRGKATVHEKWDANTGILSGDVMLVKAYQCLDAYPAELFKELTQLFSQTAKEVCEGQQYDMDFPQQDSVSQAEYLHMIKNKTAVLLGCSLQMGAMIGGLSREESQPFYDFGIELGLAFQLQDDYLDAFGDPLTFGKQVGGDIIENKKTLLYLLALEKGDKEQQAELEELFSSQPEDPSDKIATVKTLFKATKADLAIQQLMAQYTDKALVEVEKFAISEEKKNLFKQFAKALMERKL
ncbi:MAG: polyprenyl synthetase family protein [Candidatus Arcticimaribacter sp.]